MTMTTKKYPWKLIEGDELKDSHFDQERPEIVLYENRLALPLYGDVFLLCVEKARPKGKTEKPRRKTTEKQRAMITQQQLRGFYFKASSETLMRRNSSCLDVDR